MQPRVAQQHAGLLADRPQRGHLRLGEAAPGAPPHEVEQAGHLPVEHERDDQARPVRDAAERLGGEARIRRHVVAPHDVAAAEQRVELSLVGGGEPRPARGGRRVLRHVVARDRGDLRVGGRADVRGHRLGAGHPGELAADEAQRLDEIGGGAGDARDREKRRGLAEAGLERPATRWIEPRALVRAGTAGRLARHGGESSICRGPRNSVNAGSPA